MQLPNIAHPVKYKISGITIQLVTYMPLTNEQAQTLAMHCYRSRKWLKKDQGSLVQVPWLGDAEQLALLEATTPRVR